MTPKDELIAQAKERLEQRDSSLEAKQLFLRLAHEYPNDIDAIKTLILGAGRLSIPDELWIWRERYREMLKTATIDEQVELHVLAARAYYHNDEFPEASQAVRAAYQLRPDDFAVLGHLLSVDSYLPVEEFLELSYKRYQMRPDNSKVIIEYLTRVTSPDYYRKEIYPIVKDALQKLLSFKDRGGVFGRLMKERVEEIERQFDD